jgi:hypothetical protein
LCICQSGINVDDQYWVKYESLVMFRKN